MKLHHKSRQSGFTLIELLAVVAILGILAGIAVPRVLGAIQNARTSADTANIAMLQSAVERWAMENNPALSDTGWTEMIGATATATTINILTTTTGNSIRTALVPQFINEIPVAPAGLRTLGTNESGYGLQFASVGTPVRWTATVVRRP